MLKITEIHTSASATGEYVVLQNHGLTTVSLQGHVLCTEAYLEGDLRRNGDDVYVFTQDVPLKPYTRVVLFSGFGEEGWCPTTDGKMAYLVYWGRSTPVWSRHSTVRLLAPAGMVRTGVQREDRQRTPA
ncbi:MAG: lamin tail domain-containing protein [Chthonomonadales bacterium]